MKSVYMALAVNFEGHKEGFGVVDSAE